MWRGLAIVLLALLLASTVTSSATAQRVLPPVLVYEFMDCTGIRLYAANLSFIIRCQKVEGGEVSLPVANSYDYTGTYAVGHDPQVQAGINDARRSQNVSLVAATFYQARLNPVFIGLLRLRVFNSLLPSVDQLVVDAAEIIEGPVEGP